MLWFSPRGYYYHDRAPSSTGHDKGPLYNACCDQLLLFWLLTTFVWFGCPCRPPLVCQSLSQYHLPVLAVPLPIIRQRGLFCSLFYHGTLTCYGVSALSLSIPHGMHLVVPTHPYFFWAICYPSRTFPQKSLSRNSRIGFPLSPPLDHTFLPLN